MAVSFKFALLFKDRWHRFNLQQGLVSSSVVLDNIFTVKILVPRSKEVVIVNGKTVDVNQFLNFHPGGNSLKWYWNVDVTEVLKRYEHAKSTYDIIQSIQQDGDFDGFVNWSQPLYNQVGNLGKDYSAWVDAPVLRPMRLFASDWLEMQSKTKVHEVIFFWVPVSFWLLSISWRLREASGGFDSCGNSLIHSAILVALGMMKWTLCEYIIHRYIFHYGPPRSSKVLITIHFLVHGLHHKVPFDRDRLLFPIVPACGVATMIYLFYTLYMPTWMSMTVMSGTILGYVIYDIIHHYLHYGSPSPGTYLYFMKRYHNHHHFTNSRKGFGISSNFWDNVFSSALKMRKLRFDLQWK